MAASVPFTESKNPWRGVLDLAGGCYPAFLFGGGIGRWLPVFHFHEVTPERLEPYLAYLSENGYRTVTADAIARYVRDGAHPGPNSVALCFDDAWVSLITVAEPLFRRYGFRAITYVSPARVPDAPTPPSAPNERFATWDELRALQASGTVDIQAHSLRHAAVFCDSDCTGFITPDMVRHIHLYPWTATATGDRFLTRDDLGAPLYLQRSRYSDALRYDNAAAFEACTRFVRENGDADFFKRAGWELKLRQLAAAAPGRQETPAQRDAAIREDLAAARETLNAKLNTSTVRHMCFPWAVAGASAVKIAAEVGYETAFADRLFGKRAVRAGDPPHRLMRLKHQYIFCLPGRGRRCFFTMRNPVRRRAPDAASPRVVVLIGSFHPVVGGGETHARLLSAELRRRGIDVSVVTRRRIKTSPAYEVIDDIPVHRVPPSGVPRFGKYLMMLPAFIHLIRTRRDYDLMYVCGLRILGLVGVLAALCAGKRCVLRSESRGELSGAFIWQTIDGRTKPGLKALFVLPILLRNYFLKKADAFLSISGVIREEYAACGIAKADIAEIPNGIDASRFAPAAAEERAALRRRLNLPEVRLFAFSGKLNRGKGLEFIVRVWKDWVGKHPDCKLVLIGSGANQFLSCEEDLRVFVRAHGLESSVLFAGSVSNVNEYLQASDFFLFPSESEALPLALLEALATGLPTLASKIGGISDIVTDGINGRLLPLNDAAAWAHGLTELVERPEAAREMGRRGRETVLARFSLPHIAAEHVKLFRALLSETGRAPS